mmetsp:Transcript_123507/g.245840  ORF Transcript_123507/g.245840 Transcript_123507/m.245840 type:complete len:229 (+) Transcript_123507:297-983(+)
MHCINIGDANCEVFKALPESMPVLDTKVSATNRGSTKPALTVSKSRSAKKPYIDNGAAFLPASTATCLPNILAKAASLAIEADMLTAVTPKSLTAVCCCLFACARSQISSMTFAAAYVLPYTPITIHNAGDLNTWFGLIRMSPVAVRNAVNIPDRPAAYSVTDLSMVRMNGESAVAATQPEPTARAVPTEAGTAAKASGGLSGDTAPPPPIVQRSALLIVIRLETKIT